MVFAILGLLVVVIIVMLAVFGKKEKIEEELEEKSKAEEIEKNEIESVLDFEKHLLIDASKLPTRGNSTMQFYV